MSNLPTLLSRTLDARASSITSDFGERAANDGARVPNVRCSGKLYHRALTIASDDL